MCRSLLILAIVLAAIVFIWILLAKRRTSSQPREAANSTTPQGKTQVTPELKSKIQKPISIESQLQNLAKCGVHLQPNFPIASLFENEKEWIVEAEAEPYMPLLFALGSTHGQNDSLACKQLFRLDTEDPEYQDIAKSLRDMAEGDFPLMDISGSKYGDDDCWVAFTLHGKHYRWAVTPYGWINVDIMRQFSLLFDSLNTGKRFIFIPTGDQTWLLGCLASDQMEALEELTGEEVFWMTDCCGEEADDDGAENWVQTRPYPVP